MDSLYHSVPVGPKPPDEVYTIVEIPRGSRVKYEIAKEFPGMLVDRVLYSSVVYPVDYGLIPRTLYYDGDPMDVMILISQPTFPGAIMKVRPIGMMKMLDQGETDNKILAVFDKDPNVSNIKDIKDVNAHLLDEIANFFSTYKLLEKKETKVLGWEGKDAALKEIQVSMKMYEEKYGKKD
ncbi:inorganic pyrophosphatase [Thermoplasma sp. Kam2015]|uniref:inorganic diphosphatase n=1 Tax=Thermoplasma sp. Kam2015 TaxID=2094122 RepID=UPI000D942FCB|nr:inorganic diphosphatase [Thermoplasma sp. Kam2015]PYB68684.1 inorganic pyrophosphatase [Thermoplasma sp. Kam2015]